MNNSCIAYAGGMDLYMRSYLIAEKGTTCFIGHIFPVPKLMKSPLRDAFWEFCPYCRTSSRSEPEEYLRAA